MKISVIFLALVGTIKAWSINGHLFVANIAQNLLEQYAPDSLEAANELLDILKASDPELTYHEDQHSFVECSTFADDIKYHGGAWQSDYHFMQNYWVTEGSPEDYDLPHKTRNLTIGLHNLVEWLSQKQGDDYLDSYIYDYIQNRLYPGDTGNAQSYALRLLIHYVGDIVQPFHNMDRFDAEWPDGDSGANLFPLKYHYDVDELHALWDKVIYTQHTNIARPFTTATWDEFQPEVVDMMNTRAAAVADPSVYETLDFDMMTQEGYDIAETLYDGVIENEAVP